MTRRSASGFSLVELIVAMAVMTTVMAAVFALVASARSVFEVQPEMQDLQQRVRVATDTLMRDLLAAGAGTRLGAARGSLNAVLAPIVPYRFPSASEGDRTPRSDVISLTSVVDERSQAVVRAVLAGGASIQVEPNCGSRRDEVCGFTAGLPVMLFDATGRISHGSVSAVDGEFVLVDGDGLGGRIDVTTGAVLAGVALNQYWLEPPRGSEPPRLMHFDGRRTTAPVVDHVVNLQFDYFVDPAPPRLVADADSVALRPETTYGPRPPRPGAADARGGWGAGENCVFTTAGSLQVPRLPALAASREPVAITAGELTDGPWCPDADDPYRFDADLLRVRRVAVTLRIEAADAALRGARGPLFARPGTAVRGFLPDQEVRFDVSPRNVSLPTGGT